MPNNDSLALRRTKITGGGLRALVNASGLRYLDISHTGVTFDDVNALREAPVLTRIECFGIRTAPVDRANLEIALNDKSVRFLKIRSRQSPVQ